MFGDHLSTNIKRGCRIVTCDPATKTIEGKIQRGEVVPINAYYLSPFFRWPQIGELWVIREENGSWFLEGLWEEQEGVGAEPGDAIISSNAGRVLLNVQGVLRPLKVLLVSTLPLEPYDGQEVYFQSATMATAGVIWHLRYRAASASSHKWEFIGGAPLSAEAAAAVNITSVAYVTATGGPSLTVPLAGDYEIGLTVQLAQEAVGDFAIAAVKLGAAVGDDANGVLFKAAGVSQLVVANRTMVRANLAAAALLEVVYRTGSGGNGNFARRELWTRPIRVG